MVSPLYLWVCTLLALGCSALMSENDGFDGRHLHERQLGNTSTEYDYIVVGSGPGGGPLAARLAIAGFKVLLIDAGDDQGSSLIQQVPALHLRSTEDETTRWDYFVNHYSDVERQKKDSKMTYRTPDGGVFVNEPNGNAQPPPGSEPLGILYPRAGTLGGCGGHNAMITVYPHKSDWRYIAELTGDSSWSPENMRKYFQRLERSRYLPNGIVGHGFGGWLETSLTDLTLVVKDFKILSLVTASATAIGKSLLGKILSTVLGLGQVLTQDLNADTPGRDAAQDIYQVPLTVDFDTVKRTGPRDFIIDTINAKKADGSRKFLLDIKLTTLVTKVNFDTSGDKPRATGVDCLVGKSLYRADPRASGAAAGAPCSFTATREVILSAGAFNTPQLLKLSGVGPADELGRFSIPVLVDLPGVGTNMQDRYETGLVGKAESDFVLTSKCEFGLKSPDPCLQDWINNPLPRGPLLSKGVYTTNGIAIAIVRKSSAAGPNDDPDLLISGAPAYFSGYFPTYSSFAVRDAQHWTWIVLKAHSRNTAGTVKLRSTDPRDTPLIDFNYFDTGTTSGDADDKDLQAVYEGMQLSRRIFENVIPLDGGFEEVWPGKARAGDEAAMKEFARNEAWGHHASCTCPIGADGDPNAVLDSRFRVRGTEGLRVVDASVFPKIPGFYIAVPVYMISEKAADVIIEDAD